LSISADARALAGRKVLHITMAALLSILLSGLSAFTSHQVSPASAPATETNTGVIGYGNI
jgi:hypothetical protein